MPEGFLPTTSARPVKDSRPIPGVTQHARLRMAERHGRDLTRSEWLAVVLAILDRKALLQHSRHQSNGWSECWAVPVGGLTFRMIWAPETAQVVTVLGDEHSQGGRVVNKALSSPLKITAPLRKPVHWSRR